MSCDQHSGTIFTFYADDDSELKYFSGHSMPRGTCHKWWLRHTSKESQYSGFFGNSTCTLQNIYKKDVAILNFSSNKIGKLFHYFALLGQAQLIGASSCPILKPVCHNCLSQKNGGTICGYLTWVASDVENPWKTVNPQILNGDTYLVIKIL